MMNKKLLVVSSFLIGSLVSTAQENNWRQNYLNEGANYYDIVDAQRARLSELQSKTDRKSKKEIKQFERWANYWGNRIMPDGSFVTPEHLYSEWLKKQQTPHAKSAAGPWSFVGPSAPPASEIFFYPGMGRINAIAYNPSNINVMYVGSPGGGIWKTTDGGTSWEAKGDNLPVLGISDIVIDPSNENTVYIATGDYDGAQTPSLGVFKSTDGGNNWAVTGLSTTESSSAVISKLLIDPNNTSNILAATKGAIKRSTDGGANWTDVQTSFADVVYSELQYKTGSSTVIYATNNDGEFLKSTDNGASWVVASTPVDFERIEIAQTPDDANLILVLSSNGQVFKSTNEGSTWTLSATINGYDSQQAYNQDIAISPINKDLVIVGGVNGWRSTNGGTTWELYLDGYWSTGQPYFYVHSDHHEMKFLPNSNIVIDGNDGGISKGDASGNTQWTDLSSGLAITQYYNVSGTPLTENKLILGAQDNDVAVYNGTTFVGQNPGSDGVEGLWDYSNSNIAWSCSQAGLLERTMDGFVSTEQLTTPGGAPFVWQLEIHPTTPSTIFGGFADINISTDRGDNWTSLNSGIVGEIKGIAISQSDANTIMVSGDNTLKRTTNGGTSWTDVSLPQMGSVKDVTMHPTNPNEVYICYSGYMSGKVYKSTDAGANWTNISTGLPNVPCLRLEYKTGTNELFVATDLGVYIKENASSNWAVLSTGLPNVIVNDIAIHYATNKLRAATFGRGLWELSLDDTGAGIAEEGINPNDVTIAPNPTTDRIINLRLNNLNGNSNVLIYNVIGGVVKYFDTANNTESIDLSDYTEGIYFVKITNQGKSITKKVILK